MSNRLFPKHSFTATRRFLPLPLSTLAMSFNANPRSSSGRKKPVLLLGHAGITKSRRIGQGHSGRTNLGDRLGEGKEPGSDGREVSGFFSGSSNFVVNSPKMVDKSQHFNYYLESGVAVLDILEPVIIAEAAVNSSARDPIPRCHPGTRAQLNKRLESWLVDHQRLWNMIWLRGPAGTGKSAVAQTFAEHADELGRLGAAFFFSRTNKYDKPLRVIPTLAYQLASQDSDYRELLAHQLVHNRLILKATLCVQFKKLIAEPFSKLVRSSETVREPPLIVLDGLDECEGEDAQCEIIKIISEAAHLKKKLPFLWLVCSRPEPHINFTFSTIESSVHIGREQLVIDLEARNDVDKYLRDGFREIQSKYSDVVPVKAGEPWPSDDEFDQISGAASGLFVFAATALKYIGNSEYANPKKQLRQFLAFLADPQAQGIGMTSPWDTLDRLYTCILSDIPEHILPTTMRILALQVLWVRDSVQACCNFLRLEQDEYYAALRRLHAVLQIPPPEKAKRESLSFHHASFQDYLLSRARSRRYFIDEQLAYAEMTKLSLHWFTLPIDSEDSSDPNVYSRHFSWPDPDNIEYLFDDVVKIAGELFTNACDTIKDEQALNLIASLPKCKFSNFVPTVRPDQFADFADGLYTLCQDNPLLGNVIWTEASSDADTSLLSRLSSLTQSIAPLKPAVFPIGRSHFSGLRLVPRLPRDVEPIEYFFLCYDTNSCIVCFRGRRCRILTADMQLMEEEISKFGQCMRDYCKGVSYMSAPLWAGPDWVFEIG